jgi:DNA-binding SARP family transcriptional activator/tetratricopeptide (TPR) repeat protein
VEVLRARLLGAFEVIGVPAPELGSRKARTLLKVLLVARGERVPFDNLCDVLWGDHLPANPMEQLQVLVSRLRTVLGRDRVERVDGGYRLRYDWLDVDELEQLTDDATARMAAQNIASARAAAAAALRLVRGSPLTGDEGEWADRERLRVERLVARARVIAAEGALAAGDAIEAAALGQSALDHEPYDELALRIVMRAHVAAQRPAAALTAYARTRELLVEALGVDPSPETEALHTAVLLGTVEPPEGSTAGESILVGRDRELATLDAQMRLVAGGPARLVRITGEPGIGNSALIAAWGRHVAELGTTVLVGRCHPLGRNLPLQPVFDALADHLRHCGDDDALRILGTQRDQLLPFVGGNARRRSPIAVPDAPTLVGAHAAQSTQLYASLVAAIERAGDRQGVALVLDDTHDADDATLAWLQYALGRAEGLVLVTTHRPPVRTDLQATATLELGPIDRAAASGLVGAERAGEVFDRSGGNPLYLLELAHAAAGEMPPSLLEGVRRRVEALGEAAAVVRTAAVLGMDVDVDLLAACTQRPLAEVLDHLEAATGARVLAERGAGFVFVHELVRDALAQGVTAARRAFIHREASSRLQTRTFAEPMEAAFHARLGGEVATAARALRDGATVAAERYELGLADRLLTESLQLVDDPSTRLARARVRMADSDHAGADEDIARVIGPGAGAEAYELAGWVAYYRRDFEAARRLADEAVRLATTPDIGASAHALSGRVRHSRGELQSARQHLELAEGEGTGAIHTLGSVWLGALEAHEGRFRSAGVRLRALDDDPVLPHPFAVLHGWTARCMSAALSGQLAEAFAAVHQLDLAVESHGSPGARFGAIALNLRGWLLRSTGDDAAADDANRRALAPVGDMQFDEPHSHARLDLAEGRLRAGDPTGALRLLDEVAGAVTDSSTMAWHIRQRLAWLRGRVALQHDERQAAHDLARSLLADATQRGSLRYAALATHLALLSAPPDRGGVPASLLDELDEMAGVDSWWLTAQLAHHLHDDEMSARAATRAEALRATAIGRAEVNGTAMAAWMRNGLHQPAWV